MAGPCPRLSNLRTEKNRLVYVRFSDQIPRTGPGPCYKYLRELRDRRADLFLRLSSSSSRFLPPRRKYPPSFSLVASPPPSFLPRLDGEGEREATREREEEARTGTSSLHFSRDEAAPCRETSDAHSILSRVASFRAI